MKLSSEAKVGLFVFAGIVLLVWMMMWLGGLRFGDEDGTIVTVSFPSAAGLDPDGAVTIAGVTVGRVKDILLEHNRAKLVLEIDPGVEVGTDFTAVLKARGLLGEKYVELIPGFPGAPILEDGGELTRTKTYSDMDKLMTVLSDVADDIKLVTESLSHVLGGEEGEATIRNIVTNVEELTERVNYIVQANDEKFGRVMTNLEQFTGDLRDGTPGITEGLQRVVDNLNKVIEENRDDFRAGMSNLRAAAKKFEETMASIDDLTRDIGPEVSDTVSSLKSVAEKLDKGEGTIGKLINDTEIHDKISDALTGVNDYIERTEMMKVFVGYRGEYLFDDDDVKGFLSLRIQPRSDKYYLFEIIDDPRGNRDTKRYQLNDGPEIKEVKTTQQIEFSAQIAKRFNDVTLRGGLIESTGGAGVDWYLFDDRLKFTLDAFDFDEDRSPHLVARVSFFFNKYLFLTAGADDFISDEGLESVFVGLGLRFEDEDLKYLLSSAPPVSF